MKLRDMELLVHTAAVHFAALIQSSGVKNDPTAFKKLAHRAFDQAELLLDVAMERYPAALAVANEVASLVTPAEQSQPEAPPANPDSPPAEQPPASEQPPEAPPAG